MFQKQKAPGQKPGAFSRCIFQRALSSVAQVGAVRGDDLLVPVEAVLAAAGQGTVAVVVLVHVDEAVALFHLAGGSRHQVDGAPHGVAQHRQAVLVHRLDELADVGPHILDAVAVVDAAVGLHGIVGAQAVLHNEEGLLVAVVEGVHGGAQALGVDGPAPVAGLEVGVLDAVKDGVALGALLGQQLLVGGHAAAGIVAEGDKVHRARLHVGLVLGGAVQMDAGLLHPLFGPDGVGAPGLGVDEEVVVPVRLQRRPDVVGAAGAGVELAGGQHAAHHGPRHHLVGQAHRFGAGHDLVVGG